MSKSALKVQYQNAAKRLNAAEQKIISVSADRLKALLRRPHAEQLRALDDPDLTPSDCKKLREALASNLRPSTAKAIKWRAVRIFRGSTHAITGNLITLTTACVFVLPPSVALFLVWSNTVSALNAGSSASLQWVHPSGALTFAPMQPGDKIGLIRKLDGSLIVRKWSPKEGYLTSRVLVN